MSRTMFRSVALAFLLGNAGAAGAAPPDIDLAAGCAEPLPRHTFRARVGTPFQSEIKLRGGSGNVFWAFLTEPISETAGLQCKTTAPMAAFNCADVNIRLPAGAPEKPVGSQQSARISGTPAASGTVPFTIVVKVDGKEQTCERSYLLDIDVANPDEEAPSVPERLTALPDVPSTRIAVRVNWIASTDDRAVTGYLLERCEGEGCADFTQRARPSGTGFLDRRVTEDTEYTYRVRAIDAAGNMSAISNLATVRTLFKPEGPHPQ